jgi:alpha-tubulin suppressor-like RCC1 family protein
VSAPRIVAGVDNVISVAAGFNHYCAVKRDGTLWCWGRNEYGQAGVPLETSDRCPGEPEMRDDAWVYPYFYCVQRPRQVDGLLDIVEVRADGTTTCVRRRDGTIWCWGRYGVPLTDTCPSATWMPPRWTPPPTSCRLRPAQVEGIADAVSFDMGSSFRCALRSSGEIWCWGSNIYGQLGIGNGLAPEGPVLVPASAQRRDE